MAERNLNITPLVSFRKSISEDSFRNIFLSTKSGRVIVDGGSNINDALITAYPLLSEVPEIRRKIDIRNNKLFSQSLTFSIDNRENKGIRFTDMMGLRKPTELNQDNLKSQQRVSILIGSEVLFYFAKDTGGDFSNKQLYFKGVVQEIELVNDRVVIEVVTNRKEDREFLLPYARTEDNRPIPIPYGGMAGMKFPIVNTKPSQVQFDGEYVFDDPQRFEEYYQDSEYKFTSLEKMFKYAENIGYLGVNKLLRGAYNKWAFPLLEVGRLDFWQSEQTSGVTGGGRNPQWVWDNNAKQFLVNKEGAFFENLPVLEVTDLVKIDASDANKNLSGIDLSFGSVDELFKLGRNENNNLYGDVASNEVDSQESEIRPFSYNILGNRTVETADNQLPAEIIDNGSYIKVDEHISGNYGFQLSWDASTFSSIPANLWVHRGVVLGLQIPDYPMVEGYDRLVCLPLSHHNWFVRDVEFSLDNQSSPVVDNTDSNFNSGLTIGCLVNGVMPDFYQAGYQAQNGNLNGDAIGHFQFIYDEDSDAYSSDQIIALRAQDGNANDNTIEFNENYHFQQDASDYNTLFSRKFRDNNFGLNAFDWLRANYTFSKEELSRTGGAEGSTNQLRFYYGPVHFNTNNRLHEQDGDNYVPFLGTFDNNSVTGSTANNVKMSSELTVYMIGAGFIFPTPVEENENLYIQDISGRFNQFMDILKDIAKNEVGQYYDSGINPAWTEMSEISTQKASAIVGSWGFTNCQHIITEDVDYFKFIEKFVKYTPVFPNFSGGDVLFNAIADCYYGDSRWGERYFKVEADDVIRFKYKKTPLEEVITKVQYKYNKDIATGEFLNSDIVEVGRDNFYNGAVEFYNQTSYNMYFNTITEYEESFPIKSIFILEGTGTIKLRNMPSSRDWSPWTLIENQSINGPNYNFNTGLCCHYGITITMTNGETMTAFRIKGKASTDLGDNIPLPEWNNPYGYSQGQYLENFDFQDEERWYWNTGDDRFNNPNDSDDPIYNVNVAQIERIDFHDVWLGNDNLSPRFRNSSQTPFVTSSSKYAQIGFNDSPSDDWNYFENIITDEYIPSLDVFYNVSANTSETYQEDESSENDITGSSISLEYIPYAPTGDTTLVVDDDRFSQEGQQYNIAPKKLYQSYVNRMMNPDTIITLKLPLSYSLINTGDILFFDKLIQGESIFGFDYSWSGYVETGTSSDNNQVHAFSQSENGQILTPFFFVTSVQINESGVFIEAQLLKNYRTENYIPSDNTYPQQLKQIGEPVNSNLLLNEDSAQDSQYDDFVEEPVLDSEGVLYSSGTPFVWDEEAGVNDFENPAELSLVLNKYAWNEYSGYDENNNIITYDSFGTGGDFESFLSFPSESSTHSRVCFGVGDPTYSGSTDIDKSITDSDLWNGVTSLSAPTMAITDIGSQFRIINFLIQTVKSYTAVSEFMNWNLEGLVDADGNPLYDSDSMDKAFHNTLSKQTEIPQNENARVVMRIVHEEALWELRLMSYTHGTELNSYSEGKYLALEYGLANSNIASFDGFSYQTAEGWHPLVVWRHKDLYENNYNWYSNAVERIYKDDGSFYDNSEWVSQVDNEHLKWIKWKLSNESLLTQNVNNIIKIKNYIGLQTTNANQIAGCIFQKFEGELISYNVSGNSHSLNSTDIEYLQGDVNGDGIVDILDVIILLNIINGIEQADELLMERADYNNDGIINILDVVQLINSITEV